jgi:hypothetical protein
MFSELMFLLFLFSGETKRVFSSWVITNQCTGWSLVNSFLRIDQGLDRLDITEVTRVIHTADVAGNV